MKFVRGNLAVRDQVKNGRDLLLFETLKKKGSYRFIGYFACDGFEYGMGPDRKGSLRPTIIFYLRPAASGEEPEIVKATSRLSQLSLEELRRRAIEDANEKPDRKEGKRTYVERSASVRAYVLKRAAGICESCIKSAPFFKSNGDPYLEPHHTRRLADGGPDHPRWVGAICPTCHREIHHGQNGRERNSSLEARLATLEEGKLD